MHDYIICIDETGSPYLAHALFGNKKGSQKKDHKYIDRILDKAGKWRYFYTQEQVKAYGNKGKKFARAVRKEATTFSKDFKKDPKKAISKVFDKVDRAIDRAEFVDDYDLNEVKRNVQKAKSAIKATSRVASEMVKEVIKPLDSKKNQTLGKIHEKFKDVALSAIGPIVDPNGNKARESLKYFNGNEADFLSKAVYGLFLGRTLNESTYKSSKLGSIERFLDSPIAELHNKKYQQYAWKAGTIGFDKPKDIMENAQKAWGERVKRDKAKAKSMQRRGVSPQRLLR